MSGIIINIEFEIVPNPAEKGYFMYAFHHPIHGRKCIGCFKKDLPEHWGAAIRSFALNCGWKDNDPTAHFNFYRKGN